AAEPAPGLSDAAGGRAADLASDDAAVTRAAALSASSASEYKLRPVSTTDDKPHPGGQHERKLLFPAARHLFELSPRPAQPRNAFHRHSGDRVLAPRGAGAV